MEPDEIMDAPEQPSVTPEDFIRWATTGQNLAADLEDDQLAEIAQDVISGYDVDKDSMSDWLEKMEAAIELASLVKEDKTYPFDRAANVKYPLITSAALQFNARAYPAICQPTDVVKVKVWGPDPEGKKAARALRCSTFMSWQLLCEVEEWEAEMDKLLVQLPIVGDMFKKVWHDGTRVRTKVIDPGCYVVNCKAQTLAMAPRGTEELSYYPYEIKERIASGWFVEFEFEEDSEDSEAPLDFIEQNCRLDLDEDDYPEPYVVTVHKDTQKVVRIVADFDAPDVQFTRETRMVEAMIARPMLMPDGTQAIIQAPTMQPQEVITGIQAIRRNSYVIHYPFMPGMTGGLFSTGFGVLLGDISKAINTSFNMLIDAGHYASLGGGFIGQEFRLKGGAQRMKPGEWRTVPSVGADVRSALVPLTYPGPDQTLFAMLGMLIDAGKEVSSTADIMTGDTGTKNMTATTTLALIEQGMKVFTACYKRIWRSLKAELKLIAELNARHLSPDQYAAFLEQPADPRADFSARDMDVQPVADPEAVTKMQEMAKAQMIMEMVTLGIVNPQVAAQRVLEAASIDDVQELLPPPPDPAAQQEQAIMGQMAKQAARADLSMKYLQLEKTMAEVQKLKAEAFEKVSGVQLEAEKNRFDRVMTILEKQRDDLEASIQRFSGGMEGTPGNGGAGNMPARIAPRPQGGAGSGVLGGPSGIGSATGGIASGFGPD